MNHLSPQTPQSKHSLDPSRSHYVLAMLCIMYLFCLEVNGAIKVPPSTTSDDVQSKQAISAHGVPDRFLNYAAVNCPYHYTHSFQSVPLTGKALEIKSRDD